MTPEVTQSRGKAEGGKGELGLLLLVLLILLLHAQIYQNWVEDDSFITYRYGQNLASGQGLVFNSGEQVEGFSNLSWVLLAFLSAKLGLQPAGVSQLVGFLGGIWILWLSRRLVLLLAPAAGWTAGLAPLILVLTPLLPRHAVTGLETVPFAALLLAMVLVVAGPRFRRRHFWVLAVLLALSRPEGWGFVFLVAAWRWWNGRGTASRQGHDPALVEVAGILGLGALLLAGRWFYFGDLLPNTFHAKVTGQVRSLIDGLNYTADFLRFSGGAVLVGMFSAAFLRRDNGKLLLLLIGLVGCQGLVILSAGGDWMHFYRFFVPVYPLLVAGAVAGGVLLFQVLRLRVQDDRRGLAGLGFAFLLMVSLQLVGIYKNERAVQRMVLPHLSQDGYLTQVYSRVGRWLKNNSEQDARIAVSDIGAIGYFSDRVIIDMFGLTDRHIARAKGRQHFKSDPEYVLSLEPDLVVLVADASGQYLRIPDRALAGTAGFHDHYEVVMEFPVTFRNETVEVYRRSRGKEESSRP